MAILFSYFPLKTYPSSKPTKPPITAPLLWIHRPPPSAPGNESVLSADVECLKWQAHIALRGLHNISVRWDVSQDGALGGRLPNLQIPSEHAKDHDRALLAAQDIPAWIDENVGALNDLEGYKDVESRDESHAWIALLEGDVHAALVSLLSFFVCRNLRYNFEPGVGPTSAFLLLSYNPAASPFHCPTARRNYPHTTTSSSFRLLVPSTPLRCASLAQRHRCTIPRCNRRSL